jgi:hypothetical protein
MRKREGFSRARMALERRDRHCRAAERKSVCLSDAPHGLDLCTEAEEKPRQRQCQSSDSPGRVECLRNRDHRGRNSLVRQRKGDIPLSASPAAGIGPMAVQPGNVFHHGHAVGWFLGGGDRPEDAASEHVCRLDSCVESSIGEIVPVRGIDEVNRKRTN